MHRVATRLVPKHFAVRTFWGRPRSLVRHGYDVDPFLDMQRTMLDRMDQLLPAAHWSRPWRVWSGEHPVDVELYRCANPIVDENGNKMFKLEFDLRRFHPSEVNVKTKNNTLTVSAKHETKDGDSTVAMYELHRELSIPDGVKAEEIVCTYTDDGVLQLTAPYTPPKPAAADNATTPVKAQTIQVKHE